MACYAPLTSFYSLPRNQRQEEAKIVLPRFGANWNVGGADDGAARFGGDTGYALMTDEGGIKNIGAGAHAQINLNRKDHLATLSRLEIAHRE